MFTYLKLHYYIYIYKTMDFTDEQIKIAMNRYVKNKEYKRIYYGNKYNTDDVYKNKSKEYSRDYYQKHKELIKEKYNKNADYYRAKRKYNYYMKNNNLDKYKEKYEEEYNTYFNETLF
tara:strand:- start:359 stop:712 length:354 start_codon:yes stop_codon:yes gene_type:complete